MRDTHDPIPVDAISIRDALDTVFQSMTRDREVLEERLNPSSPHYKRKRKKEDAHREASRNYDQDRLRAIRWLCERLAAQFLDPKTGERRRLDNQTWDLAGDLEAMLDFETGTTVVKDHGRRTVFFDRKEFDDVLKEMEPDGDSAAHPGESAPTASKTKTGLQDQIREINNQLLAEGFKGQKKERNDAIRSKFRNPPSERTIRRALKPD
jgi:hypothetical protein